MLVMALDKLGLESWCCKESSKEIAKSINRQGEIPREEKRGRVIIKLICEFSFLAIAREREHLFVQRI